MKKEIEMYEIIYLINPSFTQQEVLSKIDYYQTFLTQQGSQVMVQNRGKRSLSYPIKGFESANYIQMVYLGNGHLGLWCCDNFVYRQIFGCAKKKL